MVPCPSRTGECKWDEKKWEDAVTKLNKQADIPAADVARDFRLPKGFSAIGDRRYSESAF